MQVVNLMKMVFSFEETFFIIDTPSFCRSLGLVPSRCR
jgi:hypothetical protein